MAFDLASVSKTKRKSAPKILLTGEPKIGKSSFAAQAPGVIFLDIEGGLTNLDVSAFPVPSSLDDVYRAMKTLIDEKHSYSTLAVDSLDWLEPLVQEHVCRINKWTNIDQPGYGKGYAAAADEWRVFLTRLDLIRTSRQMGIILISHVKQTRIESPVTEGYDAWVCKLHTKASSMVEEWADIVGFAAHKILLKRTDAGYGNKEIKAGKTTERNLLLEAHPAYPSGNRFGLVDQPLDWSSFSIQLSNI